MSKIQEWIAEADEKIAQEAHEQQSLETPTQLTWLLGQMKAWKGWYLRKNQRYNYFRVTRIIPPGMVELPAFWVQKFQIWKDSMLHSQYNIDPATFDFFYNSKGWEQHDELGMTYAILRPKT